MPSCATCWRSAFWSSPPTAAATTSGLACWIVSSAAEKSRVPCGTRISSITSPPYSVDQLAGGVRGVVAPDIVVGQQQELLPNGVDRVLDRRLGEIGAVAVPDELDPVAVLAALASARTSWCSGRSTPYFCATWLIALATPELTAPIRKPHSSRVIMRSATRLPVAGVRLGVEVDVLDLAAEHAAAGVGLLDRHHHAATVAGAGVGVLPARVRGDADADRLVGRLGPDAVVLPGAVEGRDAAGGGGACPAGRGGKSSRQPSVPSLS